MATKQLLWLLTLFVLVSLGSKPKVIYSNDNGYPGCDGDNPQVLVHFLFYANDIDIQLIIASNSTDCYNSSTGQNINEIYKILDLYDKDYDKLNASSSNPYPTSQQLKSISYQGCNQSSPSQGYPSYPLEASQKIIDVVDSLNDDEYVWYGAGAGLCELARALHDKPSIANKIRLYAIGAHNTQKDPHSRKYIFYNFPSLWYVESNYTFEGWYKGGNQSGIYSGTTFDLDEIKKGGNLGAYYYTIVSHYADTNNKGIPMFTEGDGPSYFYVIDSMNSTRNLSDPTLPNYGGQYQQIYENRDTYWSDIRNTNQALQTVNKWRVNYLNDWKNRLQWLYMYKEIIQ